MRASGKRLQQFIQDFLTFSAARNRRAAHAVRAGQHQRLSVGSLPPVVAIAFRRKGWRCIFWPTTSSRSFPSMRRRWSASSPICWRMLSSSRPHGGTVWLHAEPHMWERRARNAAFGRGAPPPDVTQPNSVKVSVSDTGPGIPAEFHLEVFDDFFRLPGSEESGRHGTGSCHRAPPGARHGRQDLGGERSRRRLQVFFPHPVQTGRRGRQPKGKSR